MTEGSTTTVRCCVAGPDQPSPGTVYQRDYHNTRHGDSEHCGPRFFAEHDSGIRLAMPRNVFYQSAEDVKFLIVADKLVRIAAVVV